MGLTGRWIGSEVEALASWPESWEGPKTAAHWTWFRLPVEIGPIDLERLVGEFQETANADVCAVLISDSRFAYLLRSSGLREMQRVLLNESATSSHHEGEEASRLVHARGPGPRSTEIVNLAGRPWLNVESGVDEVLDLWNVGHKDVFPWSFEGSIPEVLSHVGPSRRSKRPPRYRIVETISGHKITYDVIDREMDHGVVATFDDHDEAASHLLDLTGFRPSVVDPSDWTPP
jgi:hypothetical protein